MYKAFRENRRYAPFNYEKESCHACGNKFHGPNLNCPPMVREPTNDKFDQHRFPGLYAAQKQDRPHGAANCNMTQVMQEATSTVVHVRVADLDGYDIPLPYEAAPTNEEAAVHAVTTRSKQKQHSSAVPMGERKISSATPVLPRRPPKATPMQSQPPSLVQQVTEQVLEDGTVTLGLKQLASLVPEIARYAGNWLHSLSQDNSKELLAPVASDPPEVEVRT